MIKAWWTLFKYGGYWTICSKHKKPETADAAATECEKRGGATHIIVYVEQVARAKNDT